LSNSWQTGKVQLRDIRVVCDRVELCALMRNLLRQPLESRLRWQRWEKPVGCSGKRRKLGFERVIALKQLPKTRLCDAITSLSLRSLLRRSCSEAIHAETKRGRFAFMRVLINYGQVDAGNEK
jgi:hypothetical protein